MNTTLEFIIMSALSGFNNVLLKFIERICKWYPELSDLNTIKVGVETLKKYNPRLILEQFMGFIGPYYVKILNKDGQFFTDINNISNDPNFKAISEEEGQESIMSKFGAFKDVWTNMTEDRKIYVWKMFSALLKVGALASTNEEYKIILKYLETNPQLFN